jgi:indole-3-glycerol phosphate synthase
METDFLSRILRKKQEEVDAARKRVPEAVLRERAEGRKDRRPFLERLASPGPWGVNVIAEIKRASPSKGPLSPNLDPAALARSYQRGGAAALSVLTDGPHFRGSLDDLKAARSAVELPVLRKDFMVSTYQIYEAGAWGADAVLLIVRALDDGFLRDALALCRDTGLDALVEVHAEDELDRAVEAGARLIGINNRDLKTFETNLETSLRLARRLGEGRIPVAESGIRDRSDVERLLKGGVRNFLVGETLVRASDPEACLRALVGGGRRGRRDDSAPAEPPR